MKRVIIYGLLALACMLAGCSSQEKVTVDNVASVIEATLEDKYGEDFSVTDVSSVASTGFFSSNQEWQAKATPADSDTSFTVKYSKSNAVSDDYAKLIYGERILSEVKELVAQYDKLTITEISIMAPVTEKCWKDESDYESYIKKSGVYVCVSFDINRVYMEQSTENQVVSLCNDMEDENLYFSFTFRGADNCYISHEPGTKMPSNSSIRSKLEESYSDKA